MTEFLTGVAIALLLEGMMPFIAPKRWKSMVISLAELPDASLRGVGLVVMLSGLLTLWLVR
ncbi:DUF2065 domain-containing protein [Aliikangiella sp. IMCC44653]